MVGDSLRGGRSVVAKAVVLEASSLPGRGRCSDHPGGGRTVVLAGCHQGGQQTIQPCWKPVCHDSSAQIN